MSARRDIARSHWALRDGARRYIARRAGAGFGLLEALVALALTAFATLSVALLMQQSLQSQGVAERRERALLLANEMLDLIRANPDARAAYAYAEPQPPPAVPPCAADNSCNATDLAAVHLVDWLVSIEEGLPAGSAGSATGSVTYMPQPSAPESLQVQLRWGEPGQTTDQLLSAVVWLPPLSGS